MKTRIALLADPHFTDARSKPGSRMNAADTLLLRAVRRLNRFIRPDVTVVLGDVADAGAAPGAGRFYRAIREALDQLDSPAVVLPGNHDCDAETFYTYFEKPAEIIDVGGARLAVFLDEPAPGDNARRTEEGFRSMAKARSGYSGPVVALQHVPVFPAGASECPYNYTNAEEVIAAMRRYSIGLAVAGHYHSGTELVRGESASFLAAPALCKSPFAFLVLTLGAGDVQVERHELRMDPELKLVDTHIHTQYATCSENMDISKTIGLAEDFGLAGYGFAEHTDQLMFDLETWQSWRCLETGVEAAEDALNRVDDYLEAVAQAGCSSECAGFEVECDFRGDLLLRKADRERAGFLLGAIHGLPELKREYPDSARAGEEFLKLLARFARGGIQALAHPFRAFRQAGMEVPPGLFEPTARILRDAKVAAEISFHSNEPPAEFFRLCIDTGVKLTFGSDSHNLCEIGEFAPHLAFLRACGYNGDLRDIVIDPRARARETQRT